MTDLSRRRFVTGVGAAVASTALGACSLARSSAPIGFEVTRAELEDARGFLRDHVSIDAHAHPGTTFMRGAENVSGKIRLASLLGTREDAVVRDMRSGGLTATAFSAVSDLQTLGFAGDGLIAVRDFEPGEAWSSYKRQIANLNALGERGLVFPVYSASDFAAAKLAGKPGAFLTVEGGDFLEGDPDRVSEAFADGVRSITLMHYRNNELGDIITGEAEIGGLSDAGAAVVQAMNEVGMLVDVAHASPATAFGAIDASSQPVIASHVHVRSDQLDHPRFISRDLASAIAESGGGLLGAWPAGIGMTSLDGFVTRTLELVDIVGVDHVCMGTDMDANYKPVFDTYANLPYYVAGLRKRGMQEMDVAKIIGGNFLRIFEQVQAG